METHDCYKIIYGFLSAPKVYWNNFTCSTMQGIVILAFCKQIIQEH